MYTFTAAAGVYAAVYWEDDFESPFAGRWAYAGYACSGSPCAYLDRSTDVAHNGTYSLKLHFDSPQGDDSHNVAITRSVPQSDPTLFTRFFYRTHAFNYNTFFGTSHFYIADLGAGVIHKGSRAMIFTILNVEDCPGSQTDCYATWDFLPNRATVSLNDNQWYCIETETTMNNPGAPNAALRMWVDGTLTHEYTNFRMRGTLPSGPNGNSSLSSLNTIHILRQAGSGVMYLDQFAVGTTRIGCSSLSLDTTPPSAPTGLSVR
jgi:hypothetical protein